MSFKNMLKGKSIALTILMIIACSLLTNDNSFIIPTILFIGIISGIMLHVNIKETLLNSFIAFIIGSIIAFIVSLITVYYTYGGLYAIAVVQYSLISIITYIIIGCIGSYIGYYVSEELGLLNQK
ncbi:hypothetical protein OTK55_01665 [Methanosphaera sp. Vir-13MRS]|uniref:DUF5518 domain-containing protein n=2 Tax=Methanosphaera TaxID=2316 RepID=UPI00237FE8F4|nr:hypothetical protein [Candidatus Methanosphaera massiliense]MDD6286099.1 hypothetical protein [Methanobacteriaceae archaeon]MDE4077736.1 hypothetical protein [Candidatus Methanosphaera massiliense]MDY2745386.1 hypothetical protein [Methanosphaera sp.]